jgi:hypothetical protein
MKRLIITLAAAAVCFSAAVQADEEDEKERSVLGGSPPIYSSAPVTSTVTQSYKRYRAVPRGDVPPAVLAQLGSRCATSRGLFGPGRTLPVNAVCVGRDPNGLLAKGRVVPEGKGTYCATASGMFGPGAEQPIGMPCTAETKTGGVQGRITTVD